MEMPNMPGLVDGASAGAPTLADMLSALSNEDVAALVAATAMPADPAAPPADPTAPPAGDVDDPAGAPEEAESDPEAQAEAEAEANAATAQSYADSTGAAVSAIADLAARVDALMSGAEDHEKAGIDPGPIEDAQKAVEAAAADADEANTAAEEEAKADEPDLDAGAAAQQAAAAALAAAQQAVAEAEASVKENVSESDDPDLAAMRAWSEQMGLTGPSMD